MSSCRPAAWPSPSWWPCFWRACGRGPCSPWRCRTRRPQVRGEGARRGGGGRETLRGTALPSQRGLRAPPPSRHLAGCWAGNRHWPDPAHPAAAGRPLTARPGAAGAEAAVQGQPGRGSRQLREAQAVAGRRGEPAPSHPHPSREGLKVTADEGPTAPGWLARPAGISSPLVHAPLPCRPRLLARPRSRPPGGPWSEPALPPPLACQGLGGVPTASLPQLRPVLIDRGPNTQSAGQRLSPLTRAGDAALLPFAKGDLLILTKSTGPLAAEDWVPGRNDRTGRTGLVLAAHLYTIPTLTKPSAQLLVTAPSHRTAGGRLHPSAWSRPPLGAA